MSDYILIPKKVLDDYSVHHKQESENFKLLKNKELEEYHNGIVFFIEKVLQSQGIEVSEVEVENVLAEYKTSVITDVEMEFKQNNIKLFKEIKK